MSPQWGHLAHHDHSSNVFFLSLINQILPFKKLEKQRNAAFVSPLFTWSVLCWWTLKREKITATCFALFANLRALICKGWSLNSVNAVQLKCFKASYFIPRILLRLLWTAEAGGREVLFFPAVLNHVVFHWRCFNVE